MHPETRDSLEQSRTAEPWQDTIARLRETAPDDSTPVQTSLPATPDEPQLRLDLVQLHDLVHAAALNYLRQFESMRQHKRHEHATRLAAEAERIAWASDYLVRGGRR